MTRMSPLHLLVTAYLLYLVVLVQAKDYYFENYCSKSLSIRGDGGHVMVSGTSSLNTFYSSNLNCTVTLTTSGGRKILITWYVFDVDRAFSGCADSLAIYDGAAVSGTALNSNKCGYYISSLVNTRYPNVESTGNSITFRLITDNLGSFSDFKFIFTSFTTAATCASDEKKCNNGKCIKYTLFDDSNDNCGDASDTNWGNIAAAVGGLLALGVGIMIAIIVGIIVGGILICVCCGCLCYHLCCKKQPTNVTVIHAAPPPRGGMHMQPTGPV